MEQLPYQDILEVFEAEYIHHEILRDEEGKIVDAVFVNIASNYLQRVGLDKTTLKSKSIKDTFAGLTELDHQAWASDYMNFLLREEVAEQSSITLAADAGDTELHVLDCSHTGIRTIVFKDISEKQVVELKVSNNFLKQRDAIAELLLYKPIIEGDKDKAVSFTTKLIAETLGVGRVSIWFFNKDESEMSCASLYEKDKNSHSEGLVLHRKDFPVYFDTMLNEGKIIASNAHTHEATSAFSEVYLKPLGIMSMLDVTIKLDGKTTGVICMEHVGEDEKYWGLHEEAFANTAAAIVSQLYLNYDRRKTSLELQENKERLEQMLEDQLTARRVREEQDEMLAQMSTPVTQLWDGILLLPLVGIIDSKRVRNIMTTVLNKIANMQAKVFILDISGIAVVDTAVANYLIKMTQSTRLMGCTCLISGVAASVAQTIVELGIDVGEMRTTNSLKDALRIALKRVDSSL